MPSICKALFQGKRGAELTHVGREMEDLPIPQSFPFSGSGSSVHQLCDRFNQLNDRHVGQMPRIELSTEYLGSELECLCSGVEKLVKIPFQ